MKKRYGIVDERSPYEAYEEDIVQPEQEKRRLPTLEVSDDPQPPYTLTPGYMKPGNQHSLPRLDEVCADMIVGFCSCWGVMIVVILCFFIVVGFGIAHFCKGMG